MLRCLSLALMLALPLSAHAFCGFYVGKADTKLFNDASQVVMVRDGEKTVLTLSNDYRGELKEFALVVPVPTVLSREQIHVGDRKYVEHLDAYSAPRLVEYFDPDPCAQPEERDLDKVLGAASGVYRSAPVKKKDVAHGVTVEAQYTVGEYDIVLLSAKESGGLEAWLRESGYRVPAKASAALAPYIRQDMKFFVAKVNLEEQLKSGFHYLRPLQMAFESKKFMLPIRLGMANATAAQDLVVYTLTRKGRVESTNYQTVKVPSDVDVPLFVKDDFAHTYKALFQRSYEKQSKRAVFTEYVWDMAWCDPCASEPLGNDELKALGVFWLGENGGGGSAQVLLTRLHVRYDGEHFPEDLVFQETGDRENFQARYILRHPYTANEQCSGMTAYREQLQKRHATDAKTLADLTGWDLATVGQRMGADAPAIAPRRWYHDLWK